MQAAPPGLRLAGSIGWGGREGTHEKQARSKDSLTNAAVSIWKRATSKLFDLEAKIVTQVCWLGSESLINASSNWALSFTRRIKA